MEKSSPAFDNDDLHLSLGLPGSERDESEQPSSSSSSQAKNINNKRSSSQLQIDDSAAPPPKAQVVGWPPVRASQRNAAAQMYVKVSMDGAPYLRKIDLKFYRNYSDLLAALEGMFKCSLGVYSETEGFKGSEFRPTYEDKDGDWMLAGDVPWEMFITSCKRLRIMKGSDDKGSN